MKFETSIHHILLGVISTIILSSLFPQLRKFIINFQNYENSKFIHILQYPLANFKRLYQSSPFDACDCMRTSAISLMRVQNSMRHFCLRHLLSGAFERRK